MFSQFLVETEILETDPPVNSPKSCKCSTVILPPKAIELD